MNKSRKGKKRTSREEARRGLWVVETDDATKKTSSRRSRPPWDETERPRVSTTKTESRQTRCLERTRSSKSRQREVGDRRNGQSERRKKEEFKTRDFEAPKSSRLEHLEKIFGMGKWKKEKKKKFFFLQKFKCKNCKRKRRVKRCALHREKKFQKKSLRKNSWKFRKNQKNCALRKRWIYEKFLKEIFKNLQKRFAQTKYERKIGKNNRERLAERRKYVLENKKEGKIAKRDLTGRWGDYEHTVRGPRQPDRSDARRRRRRRSSGVDIGGQTRSRRRRVQGARRSPIGGRGSRGGVILIVLVGCGFNLFNLDRRFCETRWEKFQEN